MSGASFFKLVLKFFYEILTTSLCTSIVVPGTGFFPETVDFGSVDSDSGSDPHRKALVWNIVKMFYTGFLRHRSGAGYVLFHISQHWTDTYVTGGSSPHIRFGGFTYNLSQIKYTTTIFRGLSTITNYYNAVLHRLYENFVMYFLSVTVNFVEVTLYYRCCGSGSGIRCLFDHWIRDPGMNNPDHISESLETIVWGVKIIKFFDADPGSGMEKIWIGDGKNSDPG